MMPREFSSPRNFSSSKGDVDIPLCECLCKSLSALERAAEIGFSGKPGRVSCGVSEREIGRSFANGFASLALIPVKFNCVPAAKAHAGTDD